MCDCAAAERSGLCFVDVDCERCVRRVKYHIFSLTPKKTLHRNTLSGSALGVECAKVSQLYVN